MRFPVAAACLLAAAGVSAVSPHVEVTLQHGAAAAPSSNRKLGAASSGVTLDASGKQSAVQGVRRARKLPPGGAVVNFDGLELPISVVWDPTGRFVYVAEKRGTVKRFVVPNGGAGDWVGTLTDASIVLDLRGRISSFGDHGLDTIVLDGPYLYATYMMLNPNNTYGNDCPDHGQMDGRPRATVNGCPIFGRLSRWAFNDIDGSIAPVEEEDVILDTRATNAAGRSMACVQFSTHSAPSGMIKNPDDGYLYVTFGDGAGFASVDPGDLGANPCGDADGLSGAFRSQDPDRWNGKSLRVNPITKEVTVWTSGHRNPFRLTWYEGNLYATETGWYTYEEINRLEQGKNYGWPCYEGPIRAPEYSNFARPACDALIATNGNTLPFHYYDHPVVLGEMVSSVSAVAGWTGRIFYGDFAMQVIRSVSVDETDPHAEPTLHMRDVFPVDLKVTPANVLIYVDHTRGFVRNVVYDGAIASPSPAPAPPTAVVTAHTPSWTPGLGSLFFTTVDSVIGREGAFYVWNITLYSACQGSGQAETCEATTLHEETKGQTYSFTAPAITLPATGATLDVRLRVSSYAGRAAVAHQYIMGPGVTTPCRCLGGVRRYVSLPAPPPPVGTVSASAVTAAPSTTAEGGIASVDSTAEYGPLVLQPITSPWQPGLGNVTINVLTTLPRSSLVAYTCTVTALFGCSADGLTCGTAGVSTALGTVKLGRHPVFTFPAPILPASAASGATLEITCTAATTYVTTPATAAEAPAVLSQSATIRIPSAGAPVCPCSGTRTATPTTFLAQPEDLTSTAGMRALLPLGVSMILPSQRYWELPATADAAPLSFTCASTVAAQAAEAGGNLTIYWSMSLLRGCSADRLSCTASPLYTAVPTKGPVWTVPGPRVTGGGTLEVTCRSTMTGLLRVETATAYLPYQDQPICLGTANRTAFEGTLPAAPALPSSGSTAPWSVAGTTTVATLAPSAAVWTPGYPGYLGRTLSFTASSNLDGLAGVKYDWIVTLLSDCGGTSSAPTCGWSYITSINGGKRVLSLTSPDVPEGGTLEVTVIVTAANYSSAVGVIRLGTPDAAPCQCTGARYPVALVPVPGSEGDYSASAPADMYRYGGLATTSDIPAPEAKPVVDVKSPGFIGGVTVGALVVAAALIVGVGFFVGSRQEKARQKEAGGAVSGGKRGGGTGSTSASPAAAAAVAAEGGTSTKKRSNSSSNPMNKGKTASSEPQDKAEGEGEGELEGNAYPTTTYPAPGSARGMPAGQDTASTGAVGQAPAIAASVPAFAARALAAAGAAAGVAAVASARKESARGREPTPATTAAATAQAAGQATAEPATGATTSRRPSTPGPAAPAPAPAHGILHHPGEEAEHEPPKHVHMPAPAALPHETHDPRASRKVHARHPTPPPGAHKHTQEQIALANEISAATIGAGAVGAGGTVLARVPSSGPGALPVPTATGPAPASSEGDRPNPEAPRRERRDRDRERDRERERERGTDLTSPTGSSSGKSRGGEGGPSRRESGASARVRDHNRLSGSGLEGGSSSPSVPAGAAGTGLIGGMAAPSSGLGGSIGPSSGAGASGALRGSGATASGSGERDRRDRAGSTAGGSHTPSSPAPTSTSVPSAPLTGAAAIFEKEKRALKSSMKSPSATGMGRRREA